MSVDAAPGPASAFDVNEVKERFPAFVVGAVIDIFADMVPFAPFAVMLPFVVVIFPADAVMFPVVAVIPVPAVTVVPAERPART